MDPLSLFIAFLIGVFSSLSAAEIYRRVQEKFSPSDTKMMLGIIRAASRHSKKDLDAAVGMIRDMRNYLIADKEHLKSDLNGEIDRILNKEQVSRNDFVHLKKHYKKKKKAVDERRRRLADDVRRGRRS